MKNRHAFWDIYHFPYANQARLTDQNINSLAMSALATTPGVSPAKLSAFITGRAGAALVDKDLELGRENNVHVTPTLFVNGVRYEGSKDFLQLKEIVAGAKRRDVWPIDATRSGVGSGGYSANSR